MTVLMVPELDRKPWPSLGLQVVQWIEANLVFGPGALRGQPAVVDDETRGLIVRAYEVYPKGHELEGQRRFNRVGLSLRKGTAKALALDTPIATPSGWSTMGELQIGDTVFDERGQPCAVVDASPVFVGHDCYEVVFRDGARIVADAGHRWYTEELRHRPYVGSVKTTAEIASSVTVRPDGARNHRIPLPAPLQLPTTSLPVDPWILGAWLGDGRTDDAEFTLGAHDEEHFRKMVAAAGYFAGPAKADPRSTARAIRVSTTTIARGNPGDTLRGRLRALGVLGNKHVPTAYLRADMEQRLAVLRGLMDTDGTVDRKRGGSSFTSTLRVLADDVYELATSVGLKATLSPAKSSGRPAWRVYFHAADTVPVFTLPRKIALQPPAPSRTAMSRNRHIVAVNKVPSVPTRCIAVAARSHLFLAGRAMVPTHNTEKAAWLTICEAHEDGPVRTVGWKGKQPVGGGVPDPYIPLVAYTEQQSEELCFGAVLAILQEETCAVGGDFDLGLERVVRRSGHGKVVPVAAAPSARDGARTTFQVFDETHRMNAPRLRKAHQTMLANMPKRIDSWTLETTTAYAPGEQSVAESTMDYAMAVADGRVRDAKLFFFHRSASDHHDLKTAKGVRAAVREASGPTVKWSNIDAIVDQWKDPSTDKAYLERVWTNRIVKASDRAFDVVLWRKLAKPDYTVADGALIVLGFDGARTDDSTGIIGTEVATGHQWVVGLWERPEGAKEWQVPQLEVKRVMAAAFKRWNVWRLYADPPYWETTVAEWSGEFGEERVVEWHTRHWTKMAYAHRAFRDAMVAGEISHDGHEAYARHIGNAHKMLLSQRDDKGARIWVVQKERKDSPLKVDLAVAGPVSWQARLDAIAVGAGSDTGSVYNDATARPDGFLYV